MADKIGEQLSALMDSECEAVEVELALRRLAKDADLRARWQRYHLISDAMKNNIPEMLDADFAKRISKKIAADPPPLQTSLPHLLPSWYKPVTGFALAASVALALIGLRLSQPSATLKPGTLAAVTAPIERRTDAAANSVLESRLNSYLVNHNEYASMNGVHGVLPYVRMVGYESKR